MAPEPLSVMVPPVGTGGAETVKGNPALQALARLLGPTLVSFVDITDLTYIYH